MFLAAKRHREGTKHNFTGLKVLTKATFMYLEVELKEAKFN